jgi:hypothetical protein
MYSAFDYLLGFGGQKDWSSEMSDMLEKLYQMVDQVYGARETESLPTKTIRQSNEFTGTYQNAAYGVVKVLIDENDGLSLRSTEYTMPMKNQHYDIFSARLILDYQTVPLLLSFQTGIDGQIESLDITLEASVKPIRFMKAKTGNVSC